VGGKGIDDEVEINPVDGEEKVVEPEDGEDEEEEEEKGVRWYMDLPACKAEKTVQR
jgi:hypothetical protein